ncbi:hypothetical protein F2Q70_00043983 [Brassica cretica]|uniref:Uncharacterized protein n=1 Tax=Brassica cretica TaxID=69181 RepID=A0A8S9KCD9_BRACR|nr:hypothetical protein F2Q70_00043983 [Brassica cretica]
MRTLPLVSRRIQAAPQLVWSLNHETPMLHLRKSGGGAVHGAAVTCPDVGASGVSSLGKLTSNYIVAPSYAFLRISEEDT